MPDAADPDAIRELVQRELGAVHVSGIERLTGGASRETWRAVADGVAIVVQRQRPDAERDMLIEAAVIEAVATAGVPVPEVLAAVVGDDGLATMVTRAVEGETVARRILRDDRFRTARERLIDQVAAAMASTHAVPPSAVPALERLDPLLWMRERLDQLGQPHPAFELALRWLDANRPSAAERTTLVHGDFRLGNLIVDEGGLAAVLDWELAHVGDPVEDLGWACVPAWRFGSPLPAAGLATRRQLLDAYVAHSGTIVESDLLQWWEVCGILRWGVICMSQADAHRSGKARSHELAAIGRRVCENEHDLFLALDGRW